MPLRPDAILPPESEPACRLRAGAGPGPLAGGPPATIPRAPAAPAIPAIKRPRLRELYAALLIDAKSPHTERARREDCRDLARYLATPSPAAAVAALIAAESGRVARDSGRANAIALGFRSHLAGRGLAPSTIHRKLATICRAAALARRFGMICWSIDVDRPRVEPLRDCRGPDDESWRALWAAALASGDDPRAIRDRAMVRLLHDLAMRRSEVVALDLADVDVAGARIAVRGKGRSEKSWLTVPGPTAAALAAWIAARGGDPGPLFTAFGPWGARSAGPPRRLDPIGVNRALRELSLRAGLERHAKPHGLRHRAITTALDRTGGDVRKVRLFARHANPATTLIYDDARVDVAGQVARLVAED